MITISVQYFGSLRAAATRAQEELTLAPDTSLIRLLRQLAATYDLGFGSELFALDDADPTRIDDGKLRGDLMIMLNDKAVAHTAAETTLLREGDRVALFPLFPGGG